MRNRVYASLTFFLAAVACRSQQGATVSTGVPIPTSVYGHWVMATPIDSSSFVGATQVDLTLAPGTFTLAAVYPDRAPLSISGRADLSTNGTLTLVPAAGSSDGTTIGLPPGRPLTRTVSVSRSTLVLAPPTSSIPVPSSVWYRIEVARLAGLAR